MEKSHTYSYHSGIEMKGKERNLVESIPHSPRSVFYRSTFITWLLPTLPLMETLGCLHVFQPGLGKGVNQRVLNSGLKSCGDGTWTANAAAVLLMSSRHKQKSYTS